jgi:hypothetical protein
MEEEVFRFPNEYHGNAQEETISRLAALQAAQSYTIERVNKINGSIKDLYHRSEFNEKELIRHAGQCVLRDKVEEINSLLVATRSDSNKIKELNLEISQLNGKIATWDKTIAEQLAEKKENARWHRLLQPIILGFGTALLSTVLTLVLLHSTAFVKAGMSPSPPAATGVKK